MKGDFEKENDASVLVKEYKNANTNNAMNSSHF